MPSLNTRIVVVASAFGEHQTSGTPIVRTCARDDALRLDYYNVKRYSIIYLCYIIPFEHHSFFCLFLCYSIPRMPTRYRHEIITFAFWTISNKN